MAEVTGISWCDHTFNPWWGCTKVSEGCKFCYAERDSKRYGHDLWGPKGARRFFGEKHWAEPLKWNAKAEADGVRRRVFCASMADVFEGPETMRAEDWPKVIEARGSLHELIWLIPFLDWLILTKRPQNVLTLGDHFSVDLAKGNFPKNLWLGTSCEDQKTADERIPHLLRCPAKVQFLSCEPLLGPIDLTGWLWGKDPEYTDCPRYPYCACGFDTRKANSQPSIDWVITGGESGPQARPMNPDWAISLRDQSIAAGVAFHHKQNGEFLISPDRETAWRCGRKFAGRLLDGRTWDEFPGGKGMTWQNRIDAAEKRGRFSEEDRKLAGNWVTCACGEQDPRIPRQPKHDPIAPFEPKDLVLSRLGFLFLSDVRADAYDAARRTLAAIEKRAAKILSEVRS